MAYGLVGAGFLFGLAGIPYYRRLAEAIEANEGDVPGDDLGAILRSSRPIVGSAIPATILVLILADMVMKPF